MLEFDIALSALRASQRGLQVTANNLANATTPGYHRQQLVLTERAPIQVSNLLLGTGVDVARVARARDLLTEMTINGTTSQQGMGEARMESLQKLESMFASGDGSIHSTLQTFFNQLDQLATNPSDMTIRRGVIQGAQSLTGSINDIATGLDKLQKNLDSQIDDTLNTINNLSSQLAELNRQISMAQNLNAEPNDLLDKRDAILGELSNYIDVKSVESTTADSVTYLAAGGVVFSTQPQTLGRLSLDDGSTVIVRQPGTEPLTIPSGRLAGLLEARNELVPAAQDQLKTFTQTFVQAMDEIHATGVARTGPQSRIDGVRPVKLVGQPLARAGTEFPISSGALYVGVTNLATGERTVQKVSYDPSVDRLEDIANRLGTVAHVQGFAHLSDGTLSITTDAGYAIDFSGQPQSGLDTTTWTGTSSPKISGIYTGATNNDWTFKINGTGRVGIDSGLSVDVFNAAGERVKTLDIGAGYSPGSDLEIADGIKIKFPSGTVTGGEQGTAEMVASPDTGGLLAGLGLNTLFTGSAPGTLAVRSDLIADPSKLAAGGTAASGDNAIAKLMAGVRNLPMFEGSQTSAEYLAQVSSVQAFRSQDAQQQVANIKTVAERLQSQRDSASGVDTNEELMQMLSYQRMFQAASRFMLTVNDTMAELMQIVR